MASTQNTGLKRIYNALFYSMAGIAAAWKNEAAFRQEIALAIILIPTAFWLGQNTLQVCILILPVFVVLITELLNSAIESSIDRIGKEPHKLSKRAKDLASAAVFLSLLLLGVIWGLIILDRFYLG